MRDHCFTGEILVVGAAIISEDKCLVAQRSDTMSMPGKWEFPGGKVEPGESPQQALVREINEELAIDIMAGPYLATGRTEKQGVRIRLDVYLASYNAGELILREHKNVGWFSADQLPCLDWAPADLPGLHALLEHLAKK